MSPATQAPGEHSVSVSLTGHAGELSGQRRRELWEARRDVRDERHVERKLFRVRRWLLPLQLEHRLEVAPAPLELVLVAERIALDEVLQLR